MPSDVCLNDDNSFILTWVGNQNGDYDIFMQRFYPSGEPVSTVFKVNDDPGTKDQSAPSIAKASNGNYMIA